MSNTIVYSKTIIRNIHFYENNPRKRSLLRLVLFLISSEGESKEPGTRRSSLTLSNFS